MKKDYLKPKIASEEVLEQASLACNAIGSWEITTNFAGTGCLNDVSKGGHWASIFNCEGTGGSNVLDWLEGCSPTVLS